MKNTLRTLLLLTGIAVASTTSPVQANSPEIVGPKIRLKSGQSYMGKFVHRHPLAQSGQPLESSGRFTVTRDEGILWEMEKPLLTKTLIRTDGLYQSLGDFPLLTIKPAQVPFIGILEKTLLAAINADDWGQLKGDYTIKSAGSDAAWTVTIFPVVKGTEKPPFQKIVASGGRYIDSAEIVLPSGATDTVTFSDQFVTKK